MKVVGVHHGLGCDQKEMCKSLCFFVVLRKLDTLIGFFYIYIVLLQYSITNQIILSNILEIYI